MHKKKVKWTLHCIVMVEATNMLDTIPWHNTMLSHKQQSKSLQHFHRVALEAYLVPTLAVAESLSGFQIPALFKVKLF